MENKPLYTPGILVFNRTYIVIIPKANYNRNVRVNYINTISKFRDYKKNVDIRKYEKDPNQYYAWWEWKPNTVKN